jgi:hypothetical protein
MWWELGEGWKVWEVQGSGKKDNYYNSNDNFHLLYTYTIQGTVLSASHLWTHIICKLTLRGKSYYILQRRHWYAKWLAQA